MGTEPLTELLSSMEFKRQQLEAMAQGLVSLADSGGIEESKRLTDETLKKQTRLLLDHHDLIVLLLSTQEIFKSHIAAIEQAIVELPGVKGDPVLKGKIQLAFNNASSHI